MAEDDQIAVVIEPEAVEETAEKVVTPPRDETGKFVKAEPDPVEDAAAQLREIQAEAARERQARVDADRRANESAEVARKAREDAAAARSEATESQYTTVESALQSAKDAADAAERELQAAFNNGDGAAVAKAQRQIARAEAQIAQLDGAKSDLEVRRAAKPDPAPIEAPQRRTDDPLEAFISSRTEPTAKWLRANKDWAQAIATGDGPKARKLNAAHAMAIDENIEPDTPQYFEYVEKFIGIKKDAPTNGAKRKSTVPVAPVGQSGGGGGGGGTEVRLTRGEANAATDGSLVWNTPDPTGKNRWKIGDNIGIQEMARRKLAMTKQGLYDKTYTEA